MGCRVTVHRIVVLIDCDNTLLDNDAVEKNLSAHLVSRFGAAAEERYWKTFRHLAGESGYADYLGALQSFRLSLPPRTQLLDTASFLLNYPFAQQLYPGALAAIRQLRTWGPTVIVSDGDIVYQPRKIQQSGLWEAVEGRVLIYVHKEQMLEAIAEQFPARHYVLIDDKPRILSSVKRQWGDRVTTILPRQGHYALDPGAAAAFPSPDLTVDGIGDLAGLNMEALPGAPWLGPQERSVHS